MICLNPLTSRVTPGGTLDRLTAFTRLAARRRLAYEERKLARFGTKLV